MRQTKRAADQNALPRRGGLFDRLRAWKFPIVGKFPDRGGVFLAPPRRWLAKGKTEGLLSRRRDGGSKLPGFPPSLASSLPQSNRYLLSSRVAARRICERSPYSNRCAFCARFSRAVVPALGQETARTMRRFQARKRSKPHCGFAKKALSRPLPTNLLLRKIFAGALEEGGAP